MFKQIGSMLMAFVLFVSASAVVVQPAQAGTITYVTVNDIFAGDTSMCSFTGICGIPHETYSTYSECAANPLAYATSWITMLAYFLNILGWWVTVTCHEGYV